MERTVEIDENEENETGLKLTKKFKSMLKDVVAENSSNEKESVDNLNKVIKNIEKHKEFCLVLVSSKDSVILSHARPQILVNFISACASAITSSVESMSKSAESIAGGFDEEVKDAIDKMVKKEIDKRLKQKNNKKK